VAFEIAQSAMDQLGRGRARMAGQVILLDEQYREAEQRGFAGDRAPVDPAAGDEQVISHAARLRRWQLLRESLSCGPMAKTKIKAGLPTRQQILDFITNSDTPAGKREIAKAFGLHGQDKILLK